MPAKPSRDSTQLCFPVSLSFSGSHIPSFKNSKLLSRGKLFTKPEYQKIMASITRSFVSQLRSAIQTTGEGMEMGVYQPSRIVSLERLRSFDDSRQWIPKIEVECVEVPKGQEGCEITIHQL